MNIPNSWYVYHGSSHTWLTRLDPRPSTHHTARVYATTSKVIALSMMSPKWHDMLLSRDTETNNGNTQSSKDLHEHLISFTKTSKVHYIRSMLDDFSQDRQVETKKLYLPLVNPSSTTITSLISDRHSSIFVIMVSWIFFYPNKPPLRAQIKGTDDQDIIDMMSYHPVNHYVQCIKKYHPHLYERAMQRISKGDNQL